MYIFLSITVICLTAIVMLLIYKQKASNSNIINKYNDLDTKYNNIEERMDEYEGKWLKLNNKMEGMRDDEY